MEKSCHNCKYAEWEMDTFTVGLAYKDRECWVVGCEKDLEEPEEGEECEGFKEVEDADY